MSAEFDFSGLDKPFVAEWPVKINEPLDGGATRESALTVKFRQLPTSEVSALLSTPSNDLRSLARHYFIGFGKDVKHPWSDEVRDKLLDLPHVRSALERAYNEFTNGIAVKN